MKKQRTILLIFTFLPVLISMIAFFFLPDSIPAHYNIAGQVDRFGCKGEIFIFPLFILLFGLILNWLAVLAKKKEINGSNNYNVVMTLSIATLVLLDAMNCYFLYLAFEGVGDLKLLAVDIYQIVFSGIGIIMIIIGNIMPKLKMNSIIGLRTPWSMKNSTTWRQSQRFGGISFIVAGIVIVLVCLFLEDDIRLVSVLAVMLVSLLADIVYTYFAAKKY